MELATHSMVSSPNQRRINGLVPPNLSLSLVSRDATETICQVRHQPQPGNKPLALAMGSLTSSSGGFIRACQRIRGDPAKNTHSTII